ncbi:type VII secretion protein EsaA, partial [Pseudolactococcus hodotermopsidis]|uniref:type VII secretion protein EsaA n=1 Tax=Pseudolactococcus hodotermopsidis TaxID=2709157 RepID=UPI0015571171
MVVTLVCLISILIVMNTKTKVSKKVEKPTIALVNEDLPADFNQVTYNFGKNFVDLVSNDKKYNWQVVSRSVADRAYIEESVEAVIYLPTTFSHDILTLQDLDPTKAQVGYKIQHQSDSLSEKLLQSKIVDVLYDFNQSVVKMYYASVAGNLAEAEALLNGVVGKHENLVISLSTDVDEPFKATMPYYITLASGTNGLKSMNQATISSSNTFSESTQNILIQTGTSLSSQLPQVNAYFEVQNRIGEINVKNANQGIVNQATDDEVFYKSKFDELNSTIYNNLSPLYHVEHVVDELGNESTIETGKLAALSSKVMAYNAKVAAVRDDLKTQSDNLDKKRTALLELEKDLYQQFFIQDLTPTVFDKDAEDNQIAGNFDTFSGVQTDDNARSALVDKIKNSFGRKDNMNVQTETDGSVTYPVGNPYLAKLATLISGLSTTVADYKFNDLSLDSKTVDKYTKELDLIERYASAYGIPKGSVTIVLDSEKSATNQKFTYSAQVVVPAGAQYRTVLEREAKVNKLANISGTLGSWTSEPAENAYILDNSAETVPTTYMVEYLVDLGDKTDFTFKTEWYDVTNSSPVLSTASTFVLAPRDILTNHYKSVDEEFNHLTELFNQIDVTANLITTLYGAP